MSLSKATAIWDYTRKWRYVETMIKPLPVIKEVRIVRIGFAACNVQRIFSIVEESQFNENSIYELQIITRKTYDASGNEFVLPGAKFLNQIFNRY